MLHRRALGMVVEIGGNRLQLQAVKVADPVLDRIHGDVLLDAAVDLGAVAGGQDHRLADPFPLGERTQRAGDNVRTEGEPLADSHRRGLVIEAHG